METFSYKGKKYKIDSGGFLLDRRDWDENFAEGMASSAGLQGGLDGKQLDIIRFLRNACIINGVCPTVYETCKLNGLNLTSIEKLFPAGYLRGACKLAGLSYKECFLPYPKCAVVSDEEESCDREKVYRVDVRGFLVDPDEWDEEFAVHASHNLKMRQGLTTRHWDIIRYIRDAHRKTGAIPNLYQTCRETHIELDELERLFPDGYHRGAVKISGLRAR